MPVVTWVAVTMQHGVGRIILSMMFGALLVTPVTMQLHCEVILNIITCNSQQSVFKRWWDSLMGVPSLMRKLTGRRADRHPVVWTLIFM